MKARQLTNRQRRLCRRRNAARQGGAIITVLFVVLILSMLLMGVGTLAVGYQQRCYYDTSFAAAMDLAEAGVNYEFRKISQNVNQADSAAAYTSYSPFGVANTSFSVQCVNRGTNTPWSGPGTNLDVIATGTVNGTSRTIRVSCKGFTISGKFAVFGVHSVQIQGSVSVIGDVGTDGTVTVGGSSTIQGGVYLYGPDSSYPGGVPAGTSPLPLVWPTVDQTANALFPSGLTYLAAHNDNAKAGLPTVGATLSGGETLVGPGNYYVTSISTHGNKQITFDNTKGAINLWVGPSGGAGSVLMRGCTGLNSTDPSHGGYQNNIYVATTGGVDMAGNTGIDANIYAYNNGWGSVTNHGTPVINGSVIAYDVTLQGHPSVNYIPGMQQPNLIDHYGFDNSWVEVNPR